MYGYSSSSETDDEYSYRKAKKAAPPPSNSNDNNKKKPKRRVPPQQSINRIWKRFSNKRFSKALAVLPFDPVPPPTISDRSNELLSAGYERAAEECRRKVRKIIQECKRVNMRYRDPGWDIDWDLKMEKGHTLNSLGKTKFDLSMSTMMNPSSIVPKAVKRIHEIFENPTFMKNVSGSDVKQGNLGDCWLMASLSGLANVKGGIQRICVEYDTKIGIYGFVFYRDGEWIYSIIDDKLFLKSPCWDSPSMQRDLLQQIDREDVERVYRKTYQTGSKALFFAQNKDQNETWVPLIEKAYAKAHGDYASLSGGWIGEGLEDLSGGVTTELLASDILDLDGFWENELSKVNEEFLFGCSTGLLDGGYGDRDGIEEGHAYVVMEARTLKNGTRLVKLRNPWGKTKKGIWEGAWSDGSKEWTTEVQEELGHQFGSDSVFWISYEDLLRKYQHFDRTRLFRDPDWRCCQRWIGVDVPWKPQYHEKFQIKLTRETPLVIVLSQLDNRYFKGLQGQYSFRLQFRVHEVDRPDPEDYIVRSHGNYLMDRSVAVELPSMLPGTYSVFISVAGERNPDAPSVEEVVKRECKKRVENEKLAQVGYAYDLAHSKAAAHLEAVRKARKRADQKKASEARKAERHRLWEKRHLNREITRKQCRKNNAKLEAKQAAREAKRKAEEEKKKAEEEKKKKKAEEEKKKKKEEKKKKKEEEKKKAEEEKKAAEEKAKAEEAARQKKDQAVQTEDLEEQSADKDATAKAEGDKAASESAAAPAADDSSADSTPIHTPLQTPKSEAAVQPSAEKTDQASADDSKEKTDDKAEKASSETDKKDASKDDAKSDDPEKPKEETKSEDTKDETSKTDPASASTSSTTTPTPTPKTDASSTPSTEDKDTDKVPLPPADETKKEDTKDKPSDAKDSRAKTSDGSKISGGPPPSSSSQPPEDNNKKSPNMYVTSDGETSASPISDWEALYSSDDMTRKPRIAGSAANAALANKYREETEDENEPDPWNAICVVGLRVYSKDEGLELRVVMEGGELEEGGMGEKGGVDLDNAQANAGGARATPGEKKDGEEEEEEYEGDSEEDGKKKKKKKKAKKGKKKGSKSGSSSSSSSSDSSESSSSSSSSESEEEEKKVVEEGKKEEKKEEKKEDKKEDKKEEEKKEEKKEDKKVEKEEEMKVEDQGEMTDASDATVLKGKTDDEYETAVETLGE